MRGLRASGISISPCLRVSDELTIFAFANDVDARVKPGHDDPKMQRPR